MKSYCPVSPEYKISHLGWPSEVCLAADGVRAVCYWYKFTAQLCPSPSGFLTSSLPGARRVLRLSLSACKWHLTELHYAECSFIWKRRNAHVIHSLGHCSCFPCHAWEKASLRAPCPPDAASRSGIFCGEHLLWTCCCKQKSLLLPVQMKKPEVPCRHCAC